MVLRWVFLLLLLAVALGNVSDDEKLVSDVIDASQAQKEKTRLDRTVVSDVVKEAPGAPLQNGDGDIATTGACESDVDALCADVPPGEGRLATCIATRMRDENRGNVSGRKVAQPCREELRQYYADRAKNINLNLGLAVACKQDVSKLCKDQGDKGEGAILACLRRNRSKLSKSCQVKVLKAMVSAAMDFRADPQLARKCSDDAKRVCEDVPYGQGRVQGCLRDNLAGLSPDCAMELFRQEIENSDDIRLSLRLYKACQADKKRFCDDISYGASRIKDCLEEHRLEPKFSSECRVEIDNMMRRRAGHYELDPELTRACAIDINKTCSYPAPDGHNGENDVHSGRVSMCLMDHHEDLQVQECRDAVHRVLKRASQDIRFDEKLAQACKEDKKEHCSDVDPGSARVIRCLQDSRAELSETCRPVLFDYERTLAEDIDFQYPMQQSCAQEIKILCEDVKHGYARVIRCLQQKIDSDDMGNECRKEVRRNMHHMAQDYRLNVRLKRACSVDVDVLCPGKCPESDVCEGQVLQCLQNNMENISSSECKDEVFYFIKMEVSDFQNDVILAEACKTDVEKLCNEVEPGEGAMLECLRQNRKHLSTKCRMEEMRISQLQARDVRLRPKIMKVCAEEMVLFCDKISPGGGRMFNCLLEHVAKPMFGGPCKAEILKREDLAKEDYRLDGGVSEACEEDIAEHCKQEEGKHGHAEVLKCLANKMSDAQFELSDSCEKQVSRAVRMAFWDYTDGTYLTLPCDADVKNYCPTPTRKQGAFSIGLVARCLSKQLASSLPLSAGCRQLVFIAAPKDVRMYLQETMNADGTLRRGYLQSAMDTAASANSFITLNGWVAVLSVMATVFVVVSGALYVLRRYTGMDKPYTRFVSEDPDVQHDAQ
eukprot:jgi/Ulvmu1/5928/UM026_0050.1